MVRFSFVTRRCQEFQLPVHPDCPHKFRLIPRVPRGNGSTPAAAGISLQEAALPGVQDMTIRLQTRNRKNHIVYPAVVLMVFLLGTLDYCTGFEVSFSIFYLIPVTIAVYFSNVWFGIVTSFLSAAVWYTADLFAGHPNTSIIISAWNSSMGLGYYCLHCYLLNDIIRLYEKAKHDALIDRLTGAVNTRYFSLLFDREIAKAQRDHEELTIAFLDLDNFKTVNDTLGHSAGDFLLRRISEIIHSNIRPSDVFARMGGDEFAVLITGTNYDRSQTVLHRIRSAVAAECDRNSWPVTISAGAITFSSLENGKEEIIRRADQLMYTVKKSGKNNITHIHDKATKETANGIQN